MQASSGLSHPDVRYYHARKGKEAKKEASNGFVSEGIDNEERIVIAIGK